MSYLHLREVMKRKFKHTVMVRNQFHQYQQNKQSPYILTELTEHKKAMSCDVGNPGPGMGQAQKCGGIKSVNSPL